MVRRDRRRSLDRPSFIGFWMRSPPASGAIVVASGIVSIDLDSGDHGILSAITLWFAVAVWLVLAVMLGMRLLHERDRFDHEARSPAALTGVAGTAILGTRLVKDYDTAATVSLAVLGANLAVSHRASWLVSVAAAALVLGLAFYIFTAARFDLRQLIIGHGDHWIAGGALAICALAAGHVTQAVEALGKLPSLQQVLSTSTLVLWCLAMVWLLPLIICEIVRPRLRYDTRGRDSARPDEVKRLGDHPTVIRLKAGLATVDAATRTNRTALLRTAWIALGAAALDEHPVSHLLPWRAAAHCANG